MKAFLIPENIPSRPSLPDRLRQVARTLRDHMPEETTVWLQHREGSGPYLEVLDPGAGIAVIAAPPIKLTRGKRRLSFFGKKELVGIQDGIAERTEALRAGIDRALVRSLPVKPMLATPHHDRIPAKALDPGLRDLPILTRSDLSGTDLLPAIRRILGNTSGSPIDEQDAGRARAVINPRIIIDPEVIASGRERAEALPLFQDPDIAPEKIMRVMDREQERVAEHLGWGYRMVRGVVGSGKTLVLIHRARYLHEFNPRMRILILCFNRLLANALRDMVGETDRITVTNVDRLAHELVGKMVYRGKQLDFEATRTQATAKAEELPESDRYDVVMVDEAQDLDHSGLDLAHAMLKPGRRHLGGSGRQASPDRSGHFVMAMDNAQNLYRRKMTWNPPEVTGRGRTTVFRRNYRNTREILWFAWTFLEGPAGWLSGTTDLDDPTTRITPESAPRSGPMPRLVDCADLRGEARTMAHEVEQMLSEGVSAGDIGIMYGTKKLQKHLWKQFKKNGLPYFHIQQTPANKDAAVTIRDKVRVSTLFGLKGLEFSRVLIGGVNRTYVHDVPEDEQRDAVKQLLYVAMTRAMDQLTITLSGDGWVGEELRSLREVRPA